MVPYFKRRETRTARTLRQRAPSNLVPTLPPSPCDALLQVARNADGSRITTAQRLQSHDDDDDVAVSVSGLGAGGGLGTGLGAGMYLRARSAAVHEATEEGEALMQQLPAFMRNRCGRV